MTHATDEIAIDTTLGVDECVRRLHEQYPRGFCVWSDCRQPIENDAPEDTSYCSVHRQREQTLRAYKLQEKFWKPVNPKPGEWVCDVCDFTSPMSVLERWAISRCPQCGETHTGITTPGEGVVAQEIIRRCAWPGCHKETASAGPNAKYCAHHAEVGRRKSHQERSRRWRERKAKEAVA